MMNRESRDGVFVKREKYSTFYLTTTDGISRYLNTVLKTQGYDVSFNCSSQSDSCYIRFNTGLYTQDMLSIRVSNHPVRKDNAVTNFDVYAGYFRPGANYFRYYKIEMQKRAACAKSKGYWPLSERFYVE